MTPGLIARLSYRHFLNHLAALAITPIFLAGCMNGFEQATARFADRTGSSVGCESFRDEFWDGLYSFALRGEHFPKEEDMSRALAESIASGRLSKASPQERERVQNELLKLYRILALDSISELNGARKSKSQIIETLAALEMGDRTTDAKIKIQTKIDDQIAKLKDAVLAVKSTTLPSCDEPSGSEPPTTTPPTHPNSLLGHWQSTRHPAAFGALKTLATAYQSCEAGQFTPMVAGTRSVDGIVIVGEHPNGEGLKRQIVDLDALIRSHFYLSTYRPPASSCFAVTSRPLIYDYGGKPFVDGSDNSKLNLFVDAGTGTPELGIDCSGFAYSALATSGLKLKRDGRLKAIGVNGVNSTMLMNPQQNGLTCLDHASFDQSRTLRPGDLIASSGHVLIIEIAGVDPLGISQFKSSSECTLSNMSASRFDFTILQSSPSKGGIGVNRMQGSDYFAANNPMTAPLLEHAVNACMAKFKGPLISRVQGVSITRHLGTSDCFDTPVQLDREECISSCLVDSSLGKGP